MEYNIAKIRDKIRIFEKTGNETSTNFLTPTEVLEALNLLRGVEFTLTGGFDEAERRIIVVGTQNADASKYLAVIRISCLSKDLNHNLNHRSVLGSILGLGIKREVVGDIIIQGKQCDVVIVREMKDFILNNLKKIGRENVEISEILLDEIIKYEVKDEAKNLTVASLRADAIISSAFGIAREKSSVLFSQEKVLINYLPCTNNSKGVKAGDLISVRGHGRIKILEVVRRD